MITASRSVSILANGFFLLQRDKGEEISGRWVTDIEDIETLPGVEQAAAAKEITWLDNGGERLRFIKRIYFDVEPKEIPDYVVFDGRTFKTLKDDFRPSRNYFKLIVEEQF